MILIFVKFGMHREKTIANSYSSISLASTRNLPTAPGINVSTVVTDLINFQMTLEYQSNRLF